MRVNQIKAVGNFLATYCSDLQYISNFQLYKQHEITFENYISKGNHSFYDFLIEFRVARNFEKGTVGQLLNFTIDWIKTQSENDVDGFSLSLKGNQLSRGQVLTSMVSKILFLNNPWVIQPIDALARNSLKQKSRFYSDYIPLLKEFNTNNKLEVEDCLAVINDFACAIEKDFIGSIKNIEIIRYNRFLDKLLWTNGQLRN